jgi:ribosomal protein S18 acetylase RimI-like enzyme
MLKATIVTNEDQLLQIHHLNQENLRQNLDEVTKQNEGFVSWLYSSDLLKKMHGLSPSIIVMNDDQVVAYALTTLKESKLFHPDLQIMFDHLQTLYYNNTPLFSHRFYCMGQICVSKKYRGQGLVNMLYQKHREIYAPDYEFILTEISTKNIRSLKAHEKIGFQTIYTYSDATDEWDVVVWNWR